MSNGVWTKDSLTFCFIHWDTGMEMIRLIMLRHVTPSVSTSPRGDLLYQM